MLTSPPRLVRIAARQRAETPAHRTFNRQIKQIEKLRDRIAAWETASVAYREKYLRELAPLHERATELSVQLVHALHRASGQPGLTATQRRKLSGAVVELALQILDERDDAAIKAIYNEHNPIDYDSEEAAHADQVKSFLEDMFDLDLGEADENDSVDELFARAKAQFRERQEAEQRADEAPHAKRRKTARQVERETRLQADAQRVSQSVREIYRKLVRELHPDRETDPQERARKTELMQRINQAYDKRNLLQLLELQLELEHIDEQYLAGLDPERLRHFNAVLKEQILELKRELDTIELRFCEQFDRPPFEVLDPRTVLRELDYEILHTGRMNQALAADVALVADVKGVKAWLKRLRRSARHEDDLGVPF
jgi:hypothetical protein